MAWAQPVLTDPRPIRAFAFDLDETLVDCTRQHETATRSMLQRTGVPEESVRHLFEHATGQRTRDLVEAFREVAAAEYTLDDLLAQRAGAFRAALDDVPPPLLPGAQTVLEEARKLGPTALVTSGHLADAEATLECTGIRPHFDYVIAGEDVVRPKPHPEPYILAAERMGVAAAELLVFEDSERGVRAALQAGCRVVAVPNVPMTRRDEVADAHVVLGSLLEALPLARLVRRLGGTL